MARIGLFGGSFDPVHMGHLLLAESARESLDLDTVWWVPAATPPHKESGPRASARDRVEMLRLAVAGHDPFRIETHEIERGGTSYTVETLEALTDRHPDHTWFLLLGADMVEDLPRWRSPERICELAIVAAVERPGWGPVSWDGLASLVGEERRKLFARHVVPMPQIELSSSEIRRRVAEGRSIRYRTPRAVEMYIRQRGLYREA